MRAIIVKALITGALAALTTACSGQRLINALTPTGGYRLHSDIAYGDLPRQTLDVYVPRGAAAALPVVVFFYGGRWSEGNKEAFKFVAQALTSRGFVAVLPDYRLWPEVTFPKFVADGAQAVAWTRAHAEEFGGDPGKLFVMGHSAGAHIAAMLATDARYLGAVGGAPQAWLAGMIGLAGPYDFLPITAEDLKAIFGPREAWPATQPVNFVNGDEPPMLLMHGAADTVVHAEDSKILAAKVEAAGGDARLEIYPGAGHIRIIASLAWLLRWLGPELTHIDQFVTRTAARSGAAPAPKTTPGLDSR